MNDYIIRAINKDKSIRVFIATTTNLVEEARKTHNTSATASAALGRVLTAASIMGIMLKGEKDKISLQFKGNGPLKTILAVANSKGDVKGYIGNPEVDLPPKENGKLDVGSAVGNSGRLIVIRDLGLKEPYIGQSNIVSGEIAEDIANYFVISEQQPSAVALGTFINEDLTVAAAGGFIIQVLPNISEDDLSLLEYKIQNMTPISTLIKSGYSPEEMLDGLFGDMHMDILGKQEVSLQCDCNKDKLERALISVGKDEINDMINEDNGATLTCHFCNKEYKFDVDDLEKLLSEINSNPN